ncbi:L-rhamnose-binding lectin CSL3-like [Oculina patagonica]
MAARMKTLFFTFLVLFAFMEETKLATACKEDLMSVTVCEGRKASIRCLIGGNINVVGASYGRHDRSTCPHSSIRATNCHARSSLSVVKSRCDNKPSCELDSSNSVFGDPCWGTYKYLEVKFQCIEAKSIVICEHRRATLSCPGGKKVNVLTASYGRHDRSTCPHSSIRTTNCHAGNSLTIAKARCTNKTRCSLFASNSVFGDPCRGTYKYLKVEYQCI